MFDPLINLAIILVAGVVAWKVFWIGLRGVIYARELAVVTCLVAPGSYRAARAKRSLQPRDLAFDFAGNRTDAKAFDAIIQDRLQRTAAMVRWPEKTVIAAQIGRRLAR